MVDDIGWFPPGTETRAFVIPPTANEYIDRFPCGKTVAERITWLEHQHTLFQPGRDFDVRYEIGTSPEFFFHGITDDPIEREQILEANGMVMNSMRVIHFVKPKEATV